MSWYMKNGHGESAHTLVLPVKTQKLEIFYYYKFDPKFGFKSIKLVLSYVTFDQKGQK